MFRKIIEKIMDEWLQPFARKIIGFEQIEEELETLRYVVGKAVDIRNFPKAEGVLRNVQIADIEILRVFHEVCEKYNLKYWLDYGTLLGAIRHKDFIPWDDDLDVAMPRDDYDKIMPILAAEMNKIGIEYISNEEKRQALTIWKAGCIMDIFPVDAVAADSIKCEEDLLAKLKVGRIKYKKDRERMNIEESKRNREQYIGKPSENKNIWYHNIEFCADGTFYYEDTIFPLKKVVFGDYEFWAPNNADLYLKRTYGDYMNFPKNGVLSHNATNNKIYEQSIKNNIDMNEIIKQLKLVHVEIEG